MTENPTSHACWVNLTESSLRVKNNFKIQMFHAVTPKTVDDVMKSENLKWNYPWVGQTIDFASGLTKSAYQTANPKARIACALSHYKLWQKCVKTKEDIMVLEHDATFVLPFKENLYKIPYDIIGINNPLGCTRKARRYYDLILDNPSPYQKTPWTDDDMSIPQGLAGNSAYIIKPSGAKKMIELVKEFGLWPNDAIMCRQLIPTIGVTRKFYTTIQQAKSTTTL